MKTPCSDSAAHVPTRGLIRRVYTSRFSTHVKNAVRLAEASLQPRVRHVVNEGTPCSFVHSWWWDNTRPDIVGRELMPYRHALDRRGWRPTCILDAGADIGLFTVTAGVRYPEALVCAMEPSHRNRVLLRRNLRLNGLEGRVVVMPEALWKEPAILAFRSQGAMSELRDTDMNTDLPFVESVRAVPLDSVKLPPEWPAFDLVKMDIEGAEIEALQGAVRTLSPGGPRPNLLIQAYHLRDGVRTYERCADFLRGLGYGVEEEDSGLLTAWPAANADP